jgi:hypothetical protein
VTCLSRLGLRVAGAGLLAASGAIHLDLCLTGYRSIPAIGWLWLPGSCTEIDPYFFKVRGGQVFNIAPAS